MGGRTSSESKAKYNAKAYDRINIAVPKGHKEEIQAEAERRGQSVNKFINDLIDAALEHDAALEDGPGVVMVSAGGSPKESLCSRSTSLAAPDFHPEQPPTAIPQQQDTDRPYLPVPTWEDDSTPELEAKILAVLRKNRVPVLTVAQYESLSAEQQGQERARILAERERARQAIDEYERRQNRFF